MTGFQPQHAATLLLRARRAAPRREPLERLEEGAHPRTLDEGVAAQVALAGLLGASRPAGFKIGATARRMQEYLGLSGPAAGFMGEAGLHGTITVDGEMRGEGYGRDLLGGPFDALAWLAGSAEAAAFGGLRAGQVVMLGSVCPPVWLDGPARIEVAFPPLATVRVDLVASGP